MTAVGVPDGALVGSLGVRVGFWVSVVGVSDGALVGSLGASEGTLVGCVGWSEGSSVGSDVPSHRPQLSSQRSRNFSDPVLLTFEASLLDHPDRE